MTGFVDLQVAAGVATLTLNAPETRNALGRTEQYVEIAEACHRIEADLAIGAVVVTGAGQAFCAGGDIKLMAERVNSDAVEPVDDRYHYKHGIHRIPLALYRLETPVIAAVNGAAIGAGLDLACMCDIRIASPAARFAESFVRLGIIPGDGGAFLLQRIVGASKAAELTFTGRTLDAAEALACGLVSEVVEPDALLARAQSLAGEIAQNPPHALRMAKRLLRQAQTSPLEDVLELSAAFQALAHATRDHKTRINAAVARLGAR